VDKSRPILLAVRGKIKKKHKGKNGEGPFGLWIGARENQWWGRSKKTEGGPGGFFSGTPQARKMGKIGKGGGRGRAFWIFVGRIRLAEQFEGRSGGAGVGRGPGGG